MRDRITIEGRNGRFGAYIARAEDLAGSRSCRSTRGVRGERMRAGFDPRGKEIFEGTCVSCHGWSGISLLTSYATLTGDRAVNDPSAINVAQIVLSGELRHTTEGVVLMPSFAAAYSDTEIAAVANYVTARFGAVPSHLTAQDVARFRRLASH